MTEEDKGTDEQTPNVPPPADPTVPLINEDEKFGGGRTDDTLAPPDPPDDKQ